MPTSAVCQYGATVALPRSWAAIVESQLWRGLNSYGEKADHKSAPSRLKGVKRRADSPLLDLPIMEVM